MRKITPAFFLILFASFLVNGVGCTSNEPTSGGNRACTSNAQCRGGEICLGGLCEAVPTGDCQSDADCMTGQFCSMDTQRCVSQRQSTTCLSDQECGPDQKCDVANAMCVTCLNNSDCAAGEICMSGDCVEPSSDAGTNGVIDSGMSTSGDAGETSADAGMNSGCSSDMECAPPRTVCEMNVCVSGCADPGGLVCGQNEVCDTNTGRCVNVSGPCMSDSECNAPSEVCESGQCVPGCGQPGGIQCTGNTSCNMMTGRCEMANLCTSDASCNPPQTICNQNNGQCEPGCLTTGCSSAMETCNNMTGRCQPAEMCMTDSLEPNDSTMSATTIMSGNYQSLWVCRSDDDYFSFTASAGDQVRFVLEFLVNEGEVEATILDSTGMPVANSRPNLSGAVVDYNVMTGGTFYLKVEMSRDSGTVVGNAYEIEATIGTAPNSCTLDRFEPNDSSGTAASVSAMSYTNLFSCSTDDDNYAINLMNGDVITISINFDHSEGDIDLRLYQPGSSSAVADSVSFMAPEVITNYRATTAGIHRIKVTQYQDTGTFTGNTYTMDISIR